MNRRHGGVAILAALLVTPWARADLKGQIDSVIGSQRGVDFSVHVMDAQTGETLYAHRADQPMIPASNMKIVTTAVALSTLGPDFAYVTQVGVLGSTLVVLGSGDPLLGDQETDSRLGRTSGWIFQDIAARLRQAGVSAIDDIVVDTSVFDDQRVHPNWPAEDLNRWYAAEVCGLNYNGNCIAMTVRNDRGRIRIAIDPQTEYVKIVNQVRPGQGADGGVGAYRRAGAPNTLVVRGVCGNEEGPFDVAVERPASLFGYLLAESLGRAGFPVRGHLIERSLMPDEPVVPLAAYRTPLRDCLARCNKDSLGLVAESLLKTVAARAYGGRHGTWAGGQQVVSKTLLSWGIDPAQFVIDDASGLSRHNRLSAACLTRVLHSVYRGPHWAVFRDSLSVAGMDGTLGRRFEEEPYRGRILGKTGYISQVRALSGVCKTGRGDVLFSILANEAGASSRLAVNQIAETLVDSL